MTAVAVPDRRQGFAASDPPELKPEETQKSQPSTAASGTGVAALNVLAVLAVCFTLYAARPIVLPFALALMLALTLRPFVRFLKRHKVPQVIGALLTMGTTISVTAAFIIWMLAPAQKWINDVPEVLGLLRKKAEPIIAEMTRWSSEIGSSTAGSTATSLEPLKVEVSDTNWFEQFELVSSTGESAATVVIVIVLAFFLLSTGDRLLQNVLRVLDTLSQKRVAVELVNDIEASVASYLMVLFCVNLALGLTTAAAFFVLGVPSSFLWGVVAFAANFVPFFGPMAAFVVYVIVSVVAFDSVFHMVLPPLAFIVISQIEGNIITPAIMGRSMQLSPILVLISLAFWGWMWGIGGALVAVPILAITKIVCDKFDNLKPIAVMIGH